jgi:isopenicillin N synthase-like dioxygenase
VQVLSNGRYKSVGHRAITNDCLPRVSVAMFYSPNNETVIGPIEDFIDEAAPPNVPKLYFQGVYGRIS